MADYHRGILSGILAGIVLLVLSYVFTMAFPASGEWYMTIFSGMNLYSMWVSTFLVGLFMGIVYSIVGPSVPGRGMRKGANFGILVWLLAGVMWPVMAIGFAPVNIWMYDLVAGFVMYTIAGAALVQVWKK